MGGRLVEDQVIMWDKDSLTITRSLIREPATMDGPRSQHILVTFAQPTGTETKPFTQISNCLFNQNLHKKNLPINLYKFIIYDQPHNARKFIAVHILFLSKR